MSRIGRIPVAIPAGVTVKVENDKITVKGAKGELSQSFDAKVIGVKVQGAEVAVTRINDEKSVKAKHGLYRKLIQNMVDGVTKGFEKSLIVNGVGFKAAMQGTKLVLNIGFSHTVEYIQPQGVKIECPSITEVTVKGIDKEFVGQVAATIRAFRKPEPYHLYGIRYKDEIIIQKEGKTAGGGAK